MNIKDLDRLTLGHSLISDSIYIGVMRPNKKLPGIGTWKYKRDVTNMFLDCVIKRWEGTSEIIKSGTDEWEVTVRKIK